MNQLQPQSYGITLKFLTTSGRLLDDVRSLQGHTCLPDHASSHARQRRLHLNPTQGREQGRNYELGNTMAERFAKVLSIVAVY